MPEPLRWDRVKFGKEVPPLRPKEIAATPKSGVVEKQLPGGQWERTYYGKDILGAKDELKQASNEHREKVAATEKVWVRQKGKGLRHATVDQAEYYEQTKGLAALHPISMVVQGMRKGPLRCGCGRFTNNLRTVYGKETITYCRECR